MTITPNHQSTFDDIRALARAQDRPLCDALKEMVYSIHSTPNVLVWPKHKIISFGVGPKKCRNTMSTSACNRAKSIWASIAAHFSTIRMVC
jgi:hypothetical protein